jgi:hypothetical protein
VPGPAANLLAVGHLRAECFRLGLREVAITSSGIRLGPVDLRVSESMRLRRLARDAIYKEAAHQLVLPLRRGQDATAYLLDVLPKLFPAGEADRPESANRAPVGSSA